jgi:hypothetical protein
MPHCCDHQWVKNGFYKGKKRGLVQRWVCKACGQARKDFQQHVSEKTLRAFALLALGLSLDQAEYLTGLKSETIRRDLMFSQRIPERWAAIRKSLADLGAPEREIKYLEVAAYMASLTNRYSPAGTCQNAAALKMRIECIIGAQVLVTQSRQGVRVAKTEKIIDVIRKIRAVPFQRLGCAALLSEQESMVLQQLRAPNAGAQIFALLDTQKREFDVVTGKVLPAKMTLKSLAVGLSMKSNQFIDTVIKLTRKIRKFQERAKDAGGQ